jgi:hypothetical protein
LTIRDAVHTLQIQHYRDPDIGKNNKDEANFEWVNAISISVNLPVASRIGEYIEIAFLKTILIQVQTICLIMDMFTISEIP